MMSVREHLLSHLIVVLLSLTVTTAALCTTQSQPNPIAAQYPNETTGTINGTTAIIPIPYSMARSLISSQYNILTHAYQTLIPNLPAGMYPAVLEAVLDHDVQQSGIKIPDFLRTSIKLPFVDRLNDGYSSFKYTPPQLISLNPVALVGSTFYGDTRLGLFSPTCNPCATDAHGNSVQIVYDATSPTTAAFNTSFSPRSGNPYSIDVFKNVTNQPIFGNGIPVCDNYITLYNSSVTTGQYAPVPVNGNVSVRTPFYATNMVFTNVWGYHMDNAFIEHNNIPCSNLKGYSGTGSGDRHPESLSGSVSFSC